MTRSIKKVYTYTEVKDVIFQKVQKSYGYEVASSLSYLEEYDTERKIPTRIMSLKTDTNTTDTDKIGAEMFNQENIAYYINRSK